MTRLRPVAIAMLFAAISGAAVAAPAIPSSELPGRARQQFQDSPTDRFTRPSQKDAPLWQWEYERPKAKGRKQGRSNSKR